MRRQQIAAVAALALLAAGCATDPTASDAPPAASPSPTASSAAPSLTPAASPTPTASSATPSSTPTPSRRSSSPAAAPSTVTTEATAVDYCTLPDRFVGVDVERLPVTKKLVALTFDAGANADAVKPILDTLAARKVPATFFLTGRFVEQFPKRSRRIAQLHLVGNHTYSHPDLTTLPDWRIRRQVRTAERVIRDRTGEDPRRFFRFPFGARNTHTIAVVNGLCYVPFRWTVDTLGWKGTSGGMTVAKVVTRVMEGARPGEIVLMHVGSHPDDGSMLDAAALPIIIRKLRARGYTLVPLSRVLAPGP